MQIVKISNEIVPATSRQGPDLWGLFFFLLRRSFIINPTAFIIASLLLTGGCGLVLGFRHPTDSAPVLYEAKVVDFPSVEPAKQEQPQFIGNESVYVPTNIKEDDEFFDEAVVQPVPMPKPKKAPPSSDVDPNKFIKKWAPVARKLSAQTKVPASIILAQAMIESRCGTSSLAINARNYFGHKCFEKHCKKGHCLNYADDTPKDFFKVYSSPAAGFQEHAKKISTGRYASLVKNGRRNWQAWAYGLKTKGYATDKRYATSLISTIKRYRLDRFDL